MDVLYKLQEYNIVVHNFLRLYFICSYYKIFAIVPMLYNISFVVYFIPNSLYLFFFLINLFIYLFIFGCVGSSLLCTGFL